MADLILDTTSGLIKNLSTPVSGGDATNKTYVDDLIAGISPGGLSYININSTGAPALATGTDAIAIGEAAAAAGIAAIGIGRDVNTEGPAGDYSIAVGTVSFASGVRAIAIGTNAESTGDSSVAIGGGGSGTTGASAIGTASIAIGYNSSASGTNSVAIGQGVENPTADTVRLGTSATNYLRLSSAADLTLYDGAGGTTTTLIVDGSATNISLSLAAKGTGIVITTYPMKVGNIRIDTNTISSQDTNGNIVLNPNGTGVVDVSSAKITSLATPTAGTDAATKAYVDSVAGQATAGGTTTQIQYNLNDGLAGDTGFTTNGSGSVNIVGDLDVDNLNLNGNSIQATDTNGSLTIKPDGTGQVIISSPSTMTNDLLLIQQDHVSANDGTGVRIKTYRPHVTLEDISGTTTDFQIWADSGKLSILSGDASVAGKLATTEFEIDPANAIITCGSKRLTTITDPTSAQDAATKNYVDTLGEIKYVEINSTGAPALAAGTDAISIGESASATGTNSVAIGPNITNSTANTVRIGTSSTNYIDINSSGAILPRLDNTSNLGSPSLRWATMYGVSTSSQYADLAERYEADSVLEPGTVVVFGGDKEITGCTVDSDTRVAGIISAKPAIMMNDEAGSSDTHPHVALKGKVPCKVVGSVKKGDLLVTSTTFGHCRSSGSEAKAYTAVARSLVNFDGEYGIIMASLI